MKDNILQIAKKKDESKGKGHPAQLSHEEMTALMRDPNFRENVARMAGMMGMVAGKPSSIAVQQEAIAAEQERVKTNVEKLMDSIREAHTEEEINYAYEWICRVFAHVMTEAWDKDCDDPRMKPQIPMKDIWATPRTREAGLINMPDIEPGLDKRKPENYNRLCICYFADKLALYYIDVINAMKGSTDQEILLAMVEDAKGRLPTQHEDLKLHVKKRNGKPYFDVKTAIVK